MSDRVTEFHVRIQQEVDRIRIGRDEPTAVISPVDIRNALVDAQLDGVIGDRHEQIHVTVLREEHAGRIRLPSHADAPSTARIWPAWIDRFAEHDPDVEWPSDKHDDPIEAIVAALDDVREERAAAITGMARLAGVDPERDWGETLGKQLDAAGASEADKIKAVAALIEQAQETLACTRFHGNVRAEGLACVFDKLLSATHDLCREIAATRP